MMLFAGSRSMSRATRWISGVTTVGRPPSWPRAAAAFTGAGGDQFPVSRFSCSELNPTSRRLRSPTTVIKLRRERKSLSKDGTISVSPGAMNSRHEASCGRSVSRPDHFSVKTPSAASSASGS